MCLMRAAQYFVEETQALSCMSIACGTASQVWTEELNADADTVFDLASLSKLLTCLTAMRLWESGMLNLSRSIREYAPEFSHLGSVTVEQVLGFEIALQTAQRLDAQDDPETAASLLHHITPLPNGDGKAYSDMHAMVLARVMEQIMAMPAMDCVREMVLHPLGMTHTTCSPDAEARKHCQSYAGEHRIVGSRWFLTPDAPIGVCHDPKARALSPDGSRFCGHAGLFSTRADIIRLCQALLQGILIRPETMRMMAKNRTGRRKADGSWTQFLGFLCYVRHPVQYHSEVPDYMGDQAIALSGFTGNHLAIDPAQGIFEFYLGNRVFHRLTILLPEAGRQLTDYGLAADGSGSVDWPGEGPVLSSVDFVHRKDQFYHPAVAEEFQRHGVMLKQPAEQA